MLKFWLQLYRKHEVPGLVTDYDLFTKMSMTGKEREVIMEVMPYCLMLYPTPWSLELLKVVRLRNEWAALRDRDFQTPATLAQLERAGALHAFVT